MVNKSEQIFFLTYAKFDVPIDVLVFGGGGWGGVIE